jgi:fimbrial chaperone protein
MTSFFRCFVLLALAAAAPAYAFKLTPIEAEFGPARLAVQTFKLENGGTSPAAIELTVHRRDMAIDGSDVLTSASEDFNIFPDQIVLQPGETQSVRVQWTGSEQPAAEMAYRLMAEQLPIDLGESAERSGLRLMVKYLAALYVRPADPAARITAELSVEEADDARFALVRLKNDGNAHAIVQAPMLIVRAGDNVVDFTAEQREAVHGKNVLAGAARELRIPWSEQLDSGPLSIELQAPQTD